MAVLGIETLNRTMVLVHPVGPIPDSDWLVFVEQTRRKVYDRLLVWAPGVAPSSGQRNAIRDAWGTEVPLIAILTSSGVTRAAVSLLSLFIGGKIKAFAPEPLAAALEHLGVPQADRAAVEGALGRLRESVEGA